MPRKTGGWQAKRKPNGKPEAPPSSPEVSGLFFQGFDQLRDHLEEVAHDADVHLDRIVGFADIVGYTSLSRRIAMDELEQLIREELGTFDIMIHPEPAGYHDVETKVSLYEESQADGGPQKA